MITEYIFEKLADAFLAYANKLLSETRSSILSTPKDIQDAIHEHLNFVNTWCGEVSFRDLKKAKRTDQIYVIPDIYVYQRRIRIDSDEKIDIISLLEMFDIEHNHVVLLGHPGAGKTTSMKYLCSKIIFEEAFLSNSCNFPIVIQFRDMNFRRGGENNGSSPLSAISRIIFKQLYNIFGLDIQLGDYFRGTEKNDEGARRLENLLERMLVRLLDDLNVLLILDGFDELTFEEDKEIALAEIRTLTSKLQKSSIVVTS
ncbi:MAG: NACHT domain-containing protein, partial [Caldilineaceae bacterium]